MSAAVELSELRAQIDAIDAELAPLFVRRLACSRRIGAAKRAAGTPVRDAGREAEVLDRVAQAAGPENAAAVRALYETVLSLSRSVQ